MIEDTPKIELNGVKLFQTCGACPGQYDAYIDGVMVGYLRLRWGHFTVECPDVNGELVYSSKPEGDGLFAEDEREQELNNATAAIKGWYIGREAANGKLD
jgi:hypothetical protein